MLLKKKIKINDSRGQALIEATLAMPVLFLGASILILIINLKTTKTNVRYILQEYLVCQIQTKKQSCRMPAKRSFKEISTFFKIQELQTIKNGSNLIAQVKIEGPFSTQLYVQEKIHTEKIKDHAYQ